MLSTLRICALLAAPFTLTGCISDFDEQGEHESRGVPLSQAMQASANGGGEVKSQHESGGGVEFFGTGSSTETPASTGGGGGGGGDFSLVSYDDRDYLLQVPLDVSYAVPFGEIGRA